MTKYFALYPQNEWKIDFCKHVGRFVDGRPETYDKESREWVFDPELLRIYEGEPDSEAITEEQAEYIIERIHTGEAAAADMDNYVAGLKAGKYGHRPGMEKIVEDYERKKPERDKKIAQRKAEEQRRKKEKSKE